MIVAVRAVRMVQMSLDEVVDMIAVGYRFVTTAGRVDVALLVSGTRV